MLQLHPCQQTDSNQKRWFSDAEHDLFLWLDSNAKITSFQFSYHRSGREQWLRWHPDQGYSYGQVDAGEARPLHIKMSPVVIAGPAPDGAELAQQFRNISAPLDRALVDFIAAKLLAIPGPY